MKISDELLQKYAVGTPILPPAPEEEVEEMVSIPTFKAPPEIKSLTQEEMEDWERFLQLEMTKKKTNLGKEDKAEKEEGTRPAIPKHKKSDLSPDTLLKLCQTFYEMSVK
jgi:hypothetical protein